VKVDADVDADALSRVLSNLQVWLATGGHKRCSSAIRMTGSSSCSAVVTALL
jgi:hypothetical protein